MTKQLNIDSQKHAANDNMLALNNLLGTKKYAWICHAGETYLLQVTKSNKLLLTK